MTTERYKIIGGYQIIEININDANQLFDLRDPAPFREKDLDENFTRYLESYVDEISTRHPLRIQINITKPNQTISPNIVASAIHDYFTYQIQIKRGQLAKNLKAAQLFLLIGFSALFICLGLASWIRTVNSEMIRTTLREGVVIFGWVSMWKPIELLLFEWYPIYDRIRVYRRLATAEIGVIFGDGDRGP